MLVVCFGEILWDEFPDGRRLGGAPCNCALHLRRLGLEVALVSAVGDDIAGREAMARLTAAGVDADAVGVVPGHPTGVVEVSVGGDGEPAFGIAETSAWDHIDASSAALGLARRADAVYFGTLAQRSPASSAALRELLAAVGPSCLRVCDLNLRPPFVSATVVRDSLSMCDVVKMNDAELVEVARLLRVEDARGGIQDAFGVSVMAVTRGEGGSSVYAAGTEFAHPGFDVEVVDSVGAGDAFTAALIAGLTAGESLQDVSARANRLAADTCMHPGAVPN